MPPPLSFRYHGISGHKFQCHADKLPFKTAHMQEIRLTAVELLDIEDNIAPLSVSIDDAVPDEAEVPSPLRTERELVRSRRSKVGRWCIFARIKLFTVYRRLFGLCFLANIAGLVTVLAVYLRRLGDEDTQVSIRNIQSVAVTAVTTNVFIAVSLRNEHVVNSLYSIFVVNPTTLSLRIRTWMAKVYCLGGVHSGCAVSAFLWYSIFAAVKIQSSILPMLTARLRFQLAIEVFTWAVLIVIVCGAHPYARSSCHNLFEVSHRFGGWCLIFLFWCQVVMEIIDTSGPSGTPFWKGLLRSSLFWILLATTALIVYPWTRLRQVSVDVRSLSRHAVRVYFEERSATYRQADMAGRVIRISHKPLLESHAFATIPGSEETTRFSILISRSGDFTQDFINNPPLKIWIRGVYAWGMIRVAIMFKPVVIVATGSGIGPCLSLFAGYPELECRILWSTHRPMTTFGPEVVEKVKLADPNAIIIDTQRVGRQDMLKLSYDLYRNVEAEAVVIISNKDLTNKVVFGLEAKGVPAYGPIWDS
jgi:hypothetical protein